MIEFAQKNFMPVWKVAGGSRTLWFARFEAIRAAEIKAGRKRQREYEQVRSKKR